MLTRFMRPAALSASRVAVCFLVMFGSSGAIARALGPERDTSFLIPGKTLYSEVKAHWDDALPDFAGPEATWDEKMYREKPHVKFLESGISLLPPEEAPEDAEMVFLISQEERKKWTEVSVRVFEYRRYLCTTGVADPAGSTRIHLVFTKDPKGEPDRLLYYRVGLQKHEVNWDEVVQRHGPPEDVEYSYVDLRASKWVADPKPHFVFRRYPTLGVGYVWHASMAKELGSDPEKARREFFDSRIHFVPEKK